MKGILKSNSSFLLPYLIFITIGTFLLLMNSKIGLHLSFNAHHDSFFDTFFSYLTYLGDGVMALLIFIILLAVNYRYAFIIGVSNLISAVITQTLKQTVFADVVRPKKFFEGIHDLYLIPGVENYLYNSFPSGHSTCAFSLYFALSLIVKNKTLKLFFFVLALLIGYSRIYLSQHFFADVYTGSLIGVITTIIVYYFIQKSERNWLNNSLVTSFRNQ